MGLKITRDDQFVYNDPMRHQTNTLLTETRNTLHQWLSLVIGGIMLFFCFFNLFMINQPNVSLVNGVFGVGNLYFFFMAYNGKAKPWHRHFLTVSATAAAFFAFYNADVRAGAVYWLLLMPPLYCLLNGPKLGLIYTLLLALPTIPILFVKSDSIAYFPYRSSINFAFAYFLACAVCYIYEKQYEKNSVNLRKMAYQDPLTGTQNRHALKIFFDQFNRIPDDPFQHPRKEESMRLLIIDIDYFKQVNDTFGHDIGDAVLVDIADLLKRFTDSHNIYRIGGEEFLITLRNHSATQAYKFAEAIRQRVESTTFTPQEHDIQITVSIGIAELHKGQTFRSFLRDADQNLYSAKNQGRNLVHYGVVETLESVKSA